MKHYLRPALIIGLDAAGAEIAALTLHLAQQRLSGAPAVRAMGLLEAPPLSLTAANVSPQELRAVELPIWELADAAAPALLDPEAKFRQFLDAELAALYSLDLLQQTRARGWEIKRAAGAVIFLVAAPDAPVSQRLLWPLTTYLQTFADQRTARQTTLAGILLLDNAAAAPLSLRTHFPEPWLQSWQAFPFTEGCYVLARDNVYGLALDTPSWRRMIAAWIWETLATPLGAATAALPSAGNAVTVGSFGLASWTFPGALLLATLSQRLQAELLTELLEPVATDTVAVAAALRAGCAPPPLTFTPSPTPHRYTLSQWPALWRLAELPVAVAANAAAYLQRLDGVAPLWDAQLEQSLAAAATFIRSRVAECLDSAAPGPLARTRALLHSAVETFTQAALAAEAAAKAYLTQRETCDVTRAAAGAALATALERFPAWHWRAWWMALTRPRKWMALVAAYRAIVRSAGAYAAADEALCLTLLQARTATWQAVYYQALAETARENLAQVSAFQDAAQTLLFRLTAESGESGRLQAALAAAALPATLPEYFYLRYAVAVESELRAALLISGPLSEWVAREATATDLDTALRDYTFERFEPLLHIRLADLLIRTYSGEELRARLNELLEAAGPFWAATVTQWANAERAPGTHAWVGLERPEESPLVDLLPERSITCYDTGDPGTITAVQVRQGIPLIYR